MKRFSSIVFCCGLLALASITSHAKSWHGITPLKSTRVDVAKTINQSIAPDANAFEYSTDTEIVRFRFSKAGGFWGDCEKLIPPGTVLTIVAIPKVPMQPADLDLDENKLRRLPDSSEFLIDGEAYTNEAEDLVVTTKGGAVRRIVYLPRKDEQYPCRAYYQELRLFTDRISCILCPTVAVSCSDEIADGEPATFTANVTVGTPEPRLTFTWTVTEGKIIEGQGTDTIKVDSKGLQGKTITATVDVGGIDSSCNHTASCSTPIKRKL